LLLQIILYKKTIAEKLGGAREKAYIDVNNKNKTNE